MFTPFAFRNVRVEEVTPTPPAGWTPADFTDIKAWWKAGEGETMNATDTSKLEKWTDQINGYILTQSFNANPNLTAIERMPSTDASYSDLNNQPIVRFGMTTNGSFTNAPQYLYTTTTFPALSSESYTQIIIMNYISRNGAEAYTAPLVGQINFSNVKRFWFDRINSNGHIRNVIQIGTGTAQLVDSGDTVSLGSQNVLWSQYQAGNGDTYFGFNTTTGSLEYNGATTNDTWATSTLFGINGSLVGTSNVGSLANTRANDMAVAEVILIYGEPSASEWAEFKSYVSTTYGITIS